MNRALLFLWVALLRRRLVRSLLALRRPTTLIGFAAVAFFLGFLFSRRHEEVFGQLVRRESLIGGILVMLGGSLFKGFLQRGLVFEPPDVEFLFTSPFTQRQIVFYRLLPGYLFALVQGGVFLALFAPHLEHPLLTTACLTLFQIACIHVATGAAIFAGTISEQAHHRIRWMLLWGNFLILAIYLRVAWDLKIIPSFVSSPLAQAFFYPAVTLCDLGIVPAIREWTLRLVKVPSFWVQQFWHTTLYLVTFAGGAAASLWLVLKLKADIFETSLATTTRVAEKRLRLQQGRSLAQVDCAQLQSLRLPKLPVFRGVGAIVWKNLVVASRSRRELVLAAAGTFIYVGFLLALRWLFHHLMAEAGESHTVPVGQMADFDKGIGLALCVPALFLQRVFPFDFRRDGHHLVGFRTLPVSSFALALAEIAVPTVFCLAFQAAGIAALFLFTGFDVSLLLLALLGFPAVALALNGVWNVHYLLAATKRVGGQAESASPVAMLMVVALSFLIFYPAGWAAIEVGRRTFGRFSEPLAFGTFLAVQYAVDFLLVLMMARLYQRFEVSRDSR